MCLSAKIIKINFIIRVTKGPLGQCLIFYTWLKRREVYLQPVPRFSNYASKPIPQVVQRVGLCFVSRENTKSGETAIRDA